MTWFTGILQYFRNLKNTRLYRRLPVSEVEVKIIPLGSSSPTIKKIANWSPGGLFVVTEDVLPLESKVTLELSLEMPASSTVSLEGQVVRHQTDKDTGEIEGMGIMFTNFTQKGLQVLRDLLLSATKQEISP